MSPTYNIASQKKTRHTLRQNQPVAEGLLWRFISNRQLKGYKFRRQYGIGPYVVDFYCCELTLALEIDGPTHFTGIQTKKNDTKRQIYIESLGIKVIRFTNSDIFNNIDTVLHMLLQEMEGRSTQTSP